MRRWSVRTQWNPKFIDLDSLRSDEAGDFELAPTALVYGPTVPQIPAYFKR
jgi:hypothetical protein